MLMFEYILCDIAYSTQMYLADSINQIPVSFITIIFFWLPYSESIKAYNLHGYTCTKTLWQSITKEWVEIPVNFLFFHYKLIQWSQFSTLINMPHTY